MNNNDFKWEEFNTTFIDFIDKDNSIYAISENEKEASLIVENNNEIYLTRYYKEDEYIKFDDNIVKFNTVKECLSYLRDIRVDHAINYAYKDLSKKLISELYMNNYVKTKDII